MADNFNMKQFLAENKLGAYSRIKEVDEAKEKEEAFGGINEMLSPQAYERMASLSSIRAQQAMIQAAEIMMRELTDEGFEVEEVREFFNQLIANDI